MAPPNLIVLGIFAFLCLVGIEAQQTFQFSSFSSIPQALLDQMGSAQIENLKQQLNGGGGGGGNGGNGGNAIPTFQVGSPGGSPGQGQQMQFSRFSQIPQSILNNMPSDQVEQMRQALMGNGGGAVPTFQVGSPGGSPGQGQQLQFSRFSQIPQSILDNMPSDQVEQMRLALMGNGGGDIQTFQIGGGGGQPTGQTFQFSSFSQIPQSLLDQLSSAQIEHIRQELTPTYTTITQQIPQQIPQGNTQTLQFSKFSEIPQSVLDQFTSDQITQIRVALQGGGTVQLPATVTTYSYTIPGGSNSRVNNALNTIFNYVAAGGYLTGVPPIDLLLIRFYINMGPEKFCG